MTSHQSASRTAFIAAVFGAGLMIAFQTAAKATRDALFLSSHDVSLLPRMVVLSALVSMVAALAASRWMTRFGPGRLIPVAFGLSAVLLMVEFALVDAFRGPIAVVLYLHFGALGAVLISGFWSVVNERWDPRTAKRYVGRIAAGGTIGGLAGGLLAERVGALLASVVAMLPILAGFHVACGLLVLAMRVSGPGAAPPRPDADARTTRSGLATIAGTPYLRGLVALVLLVTVSEVVIDYVFKARATEVFGRGDELLRLFALFYTAVSLLTVVVQAAASRPALQRLGLTRTVALLPVGAAAGAMGALAVPGIVSVTIARGIEAILRNGLYRAGYELLFTPITPSQKRAAKTLVDVGVVRIGDIVGSGMVQATLLPSVAAATRTLLGVAVVLSVGAIVVALRLRRGYVRTLERSLLSRAVQLDLSEVEDAITRSTVLQSAGGLGITAVRPGITGTAEVAAEVQIPEPASTAASLDPEARQIVDLRSRETGRVRAVLEGETLSPSLVPHIIPLLAWDEMVHDAIGALRRLAPQVTGQLIDHLLDQHEEFTIRRRIPLVLVTCPTGRAVEGLLRGLEDSRFEVRYRCGRVLSRLLELNPKLTAAEERVHEIVLREVDVDRGVWESHRLLDRLDDEEWSPVMDELLRERANRGLEHVFTILSLVMARQPLKVAFRGLHTDDVLLRGTALEYLETALPDRIRDALWPFLEDTGRPRHVRRSANDVLADLLASNQSIAVNLEELRKRRGSGATD